MALVFYAKGVGRGGPRVEGPRGASGHPRLSRRCPVFSAPDSTSARSEASLGKRVHTCADFRLDRALIFSVAVELVVHHSSIIIPLRVSLFLVEIPSAAARNSFS